MSRYYFDLHNGDGPTRDTEGMEMASREDVSREISKIILDLARDETVSMNRLTITVTVRNESGNAISVANLTYNNEWLDV